MLIWEAKKEETIRKIKSAEGVLDEHKGLAIGLVKNAKRGRILDMVHKAILALSHRNLTVALVNKIKPLEAAKLHSHELDDLLALAKRVESRSYEPALV